MKKVFILFSMLISVSLAHAGETVLTYGSSEITREEVFGENSLSKAHIDSAAAEKLFGLISLVIARENAGGDLYEEAEDYAREQEEIARRNLSSGQMLELTDQMEMVRVGLDMYRTHTASGTSVTQSLTLAWDVASSNSQPNMSFSDFSRFVQMYGDSDDSYAAYIKTIPKNIDDAIERSQNGWIGHGLQSIFYDKMTSDVKLTKSDLLRANELSGSNPNILDLQTTSSILNLKKNRVVSKFIYSKLKANGKFSTSQYSNEFYLWLDERMQFYNKLFD